MGLLQRAYDTYCAAESRVGVYEEGRQPLAPVSYMIARAKIAVTLDRNGRFLSAERMGEEGEKILIPVTLKSAGRTSAPAAHPLCEQIAYLDGSSEEKLRLYLTQLEDWAASPWTHPKLRPVLTYVQSRCLPSDLERCGLAEAKKEKDERMVCWRILDTDSDTPPECWRDTTLFRAYIGYYASVRGLAQDLCMVSGKVADVSDQHPKGVVPLHGNAKIISSNDTKGFTYRGRFTDARQAETVSYDVSQKAHAALSWLVADQGVRFGKRTFLLWDPHGAEIPPSHLPLLPWDGPPRYSPSDYRRDLHRTLFSGRERLPRDANAVMAVFDAATAGRLALTYYSELPAADLLTRLHDWDESCCWFHGKFGVQSPRLCDIVNAAYGTPRTEKDRLRFVTDDRVFAQQMQRLIVCRVECGRMPADILLRLVNRASAPTACDEALWRELVFAACAVIQKYHAPMAKEDLCMEWELDRRERSFQFGRLLAVMERAEEDFRSNREGDGGRQTNALRSLSAFKETPLRIGERVNEQLENAYLPRLGKWQRDRYRRLRDEILALLCECGGDLNAPLNEFYLIGYSLQRNAFFQKNAPASREPEDNEED